jgi:hypothetical protein
MQEYKVSDSINIFVKRFLMYHPTYLLHAELEDFPQYVSCSSLVVNVLALMDIYLGRFAGSMYDSVLDLGLKTEELSVWDEQKLPVGSLCWFGIDRPYKKFGWTHINHVVVAIDDGIILQCCQNLVGIQAVQDCSRRPVMICDIFDPDNWERVQSPDVAGIVTFNDERYLKAIHTPL